MALTLIKEDGTGKVDANAYANAADGVAITRDTCMRRRGRLPLLNRKTLRS